VAPPGAGEIVAGPWTVVVAASRAVEAMASAAFAVSWVVVIGLL
jgi:hypothetical protein